MPFTTAKQLFCRFLVLFYFKPLQEIALFAFIPLVSFYMISLLLIFKSED